ncbi:MAG: DNA phosphorothioation system sulfurtransferase DndC [Oscillatoriales cyanobacterium RM2_1_1]|nr:DNA phosphorothioation system sulfurtransferase DndC [Oscillatoriales cyanobacterium SM2_3_0]NJO44452.1 DNA phosphorothioation system sulfurtransferase DndC [Oscillatoriales cyanobacterium RM2_1_1]
MTSVTETEHSNSIRTVPELLKDIQLLTQEIQALYTLDQVPWVIGYSGGKDSTTVLQLVWNAISTLPPDQRTKPIHVISTDTLVENPIIATWVNQSLDRMKTAAQAANLPFQPHPLKPNVENTFWVNLIGKGYPAPRQKFRWCTERLKIQPSNQFVRDIVRDNGETILVLGTRKAESQKRAATMDKHAEKRLRDRLSPNASLPNSLIYSPIEDWSNNCVWLYLHQYPNPWGHSNKDLFLIYRGATADNECPLVVDTSTPSCGSSRFGCWVCTLVDRDKSMEAMVLNDESKEWMQPLLDFRDELDFRSDAKREAERQHRDFRRLTGHVQLFERQNRDTQEKEVVNIPGPYLKFWREHLLRQLLVTQQQVRQAAPAEMKNIELISLAELSEIRRIWRDEKHEFDDALPRIYREVTGEIFRDFRPDLENPDLGAEEWKILEELCPDALHLELLARLLSTERQFLTRGNRKNLYNRLEACFESCSRSQEEAFNVAHQERELQEFKNQHQAHPGDIEQARQLKDWTSMKFGAPNP